MYCSVNEEQPCSSSARGGLWPLRRQQPQPQFLRLWQKSLIVGCTRRGMIQDTPSPSEPIFKARLRQDEDDATKQIMPFRKSVAWVLPTPATISAPPSPLFACWEGRAYSSFRTSVKGVRYLHINNLLLAAATGRHREARWSAHGKIKRSTHGNTCCCYATPLRG